MEEEEVINWMEKAEQSRRFFRFDIDYFSALIDSYYHTESNDCMLDGGGIVDEERLQEESERFVGTIKDAEIIYSKLNEAMWSWHKANSYQRIEGYRWDDVLGRIDDLLEVYHEDLGDALEVSARIDQEPELDSPIYLRSEQRRTEQPEIDQLR